MPLRRTVPALAAALLGTGMLLAPTASAAAPPTYVALGDSYAAGFGLPAPSVATGVPVPGCAQTNLDYPHRLAGSLGLTLTDVTCSGAVAGDFFTPQEVSAGPKPAAQLDVFKKMQPDLVTITIGGNDLGFSAIAQTCVAASPQGPIYSSLAAGTPFASCKAFFSSPAGRASNPYAQVSAVAAKIRAAIAAVRAAAPNAKIAVIGDPAIAPDAANTPPGGCFVANRLAKPVTLPNGVTLSSALPFTDVDVPYLQVLQQSLDTAIATQAAELGVSYADVYPASLAHSACSPENTRWVEPVIPGGGGSNVLHPSLAGTQAMAATLQPVVRNLLTAAPATPTPTPSAAPAPAPTAVPAPVATAAPLPPSTVATTPSAPAPSASAVPVPAAPTAAATTTSAVAATDGTNTGPLAYTGAGSVVPLLSVGGALLAAGGALVASTRRRRRP